MRGNNYFRERDGINAWFKLPKFRVWKYLAIGVGIAIIILMLSTIVFKDSLTLRAVLIMRGCAGVLGLVFVVLAAIYYYLVYNDYVKHRLGQRKNK